MLVFDMIKRLLPVSSRSFHAFEDHVCRTLDEEEGREADFRRMVVEEIRTLSKRMDGHSERLDALHARVEQADYGINGNIDYKFEERTLPILRKMEGTLDAHDAFSSMVLWDGYRREEETLLDAKKRLFREMPPATGGLRLHQLASSQLLREFDALCLAGGIRYWIAFGTQLGAERHGGFVPWDDDLDVGILRDDLALLRKMVEEDPRYRITDVFDVYVHCQQIRFLFADPAIPCFIDLFVYDLTNDVSREVFDAQGALRREMVAELDSDESLARWRDVGYLPAADPLMEGVSLRFEQLLKAVRDVGVGVDERSARGIIWGADNMDDPAREWVCPYEDVFPLKRVEFEGVECYAPRCSLKMLEEGYGDIYAFPADLKTHLTHISREALGDPVTRARMERLTGEGSANPPSSGMRLEEEDGLCQSQ